VPEISFNCPYTTREGHCPPSQGWTYHHVLPVRYYWSAAFILVKLLRLEQIRNSGQDSANLTAEFGNKNALDMLADFSPEIRVLRAACLSLHHSPGNNLAVARLSTARLVGDWWTDERIAETVAELTGPQYGGFAGMSPLQRTDDPGSKVEKKKPLSFPQPQWDSLQALAAVMHNCVAKIASQVNGPYKCTITPKNAEKLLSHITELKDTYLHVAPFNATDWKMNTSTQWCFINLPSGAVDPQNLERNGTVCGQVFKLGDDALGVTTQSPDANTPLTKPAGTQVTTVARSTDRAKLQFVRVN